MKLPLITSFLALTATTYADTVGHWRFEDAGAAAGSPITQAINSTAPGTADAAPSGGTPVYSSDVPLAEIFDPITGQTYTNTFSFDASDGNSQLLTPDSDAFDSSFTVEFFIKIIGEPASYETVLRRAEFVDLSWQVDFDHAASLGFGRLRTRWDTPAGAPDGIADQATDENFNFVLGAGGNATAPKIYIDTGAKDEFGADVGPQNTGNPQDYIYDSASANPNEQDVALQGDGINDVDEWHHVAMTFDETTGEIRFYFNYQLAQTRVLEDTEGDGYTHPAAGLSIGKHASTANGMLIDEVRYSDQILTAGNFLRQPTTGTGSTIAHWRMEDSGAIEGAPIGTVSNDVSPLHGATPAGGTPTYSIDIPGTTIFDPVSNTRSPNAFSLDASTVSSRLGSSDDPAFNTSFTFEMFMKVTGEPGGYHPFVRRRELNDLRWQIDFDHANTGAYGRIRSRFDTPLGAPDNSNTDDENNNFVVGPTGGASVPASQRIFIDTDLDDGLVESYDDPADWSLDGNGVNDSSEWHHVAITLDQETGEVGFYFDYELMQLNTLSDSAGDGYTHPMGAIQFGKFAAEPYGLLIDEVRYSGEVLLPFQFLQAENVEPPGLEFLSFDYNEVANAPSFTWRSVPGNKYGIDRSFDLKNWFELIEDDVFPNAISSYTDTSLPIVPTRVYYRVRDVE